jgi:hypothetical protein
MSVTRTRATTRRVLEQLRRDPRTVALLLVVPMLLLWLLELVFDQQPATFDHIGPALLALFPFVVMFLVTSVTTLLPLSYAVDAMQRITVEANVSARTLVDLAVVVAAIALCVVLGAATLRRRTA